MGEQVNLAGVVEIAAERVDVERAIKTLSRDLGTRGFHRSGNGTYTFTQQLRWDRPTSLGEIRPTATITVGASDIASPGTTVVVEVPVDRSALPAEYADGILAEWNEWFAATAVPAFAERINAVLLASRGLDLG